MSLSSVELWQRISAAGLAAPMICRTWAAEALQGQPPGAAADAEVILAQLVRLGRLTDYQADLIAGRRQGDFKRGAWTLLRPVSVPLWGEWFEAVKSPNAPTDWVRWLDSESLARCRTSAPSLPRGLRVAQVQGKYLQAVMIPELIDKQLQLQVAPLKGIPLSLASKAPAHLAEKATLIVLQVAQALQPLHAAGIAHGRVLPDRIYWDKATNEVTLARDPLCAATATLDATAAGVVEQDLGGLAATQFMAPEFLTPGQLPTLYTDIYRLGCTWWWLVTGRPLVAGSTMEKQLARQAEAPLTMPKDCPLAAPFVRVLQHCLAKNIPARFASADALVRALEAAGTVVAKGLIPRESRATEAVTLPAAEVPADVPVVAELVVEVATYAVQPAAASATALTVSESIEKRAEPVALAPVAVKASSVAAEASTQPMTPRPSAPQPSATQPSATQPSATQPSATQPSRTKRQTQRKAASAVTKRKVAKRPKGNKWLLPVVGGFGFISLLLFTLLLSGGLNFSGSPDPGVAPVGNFVPSVTDVAPEMRQRDPRLELYRIVSSGKDTLWAPPAAPQPLALNLLPPGGQMFLSFHPQTLLTTATTKTLLSALGQDVTPWLSNVVLRVGQPLELISQCTVAFYAEAEQPVTCLRIRLEQPQLLSALKTAWGITGEEKVGEQTLLTNASGESFYVASQPLTDIQSVSEFSLGPTSLMREVAEVEGAIGPLVTQMEKLWQASDSAADISLLLAPSYLFSEGKSLLNQAPKRFAAQVKGLLGNDMRAALVQTRLEPQWYIETQFVGLQDRDTGRISEDLRQRILGSSTVAEEWLVSESAHPYWRPLALRFPQMLRTLGEQARFGVEGGVAIANAYLPSEAATNILLASWIAWQDGATLASDAAAVASPTAMTEAAKPLTLDEYLGRSIKLSFDQEPIEVALKLVGDEANANLPAGTPPWRFELDGGAFEKAGITRNQQLRDFKHVDKPVREALTAIAKRGNPVTTVTDTRDKDQRLIWVVRDDPQQPGQKLVSLTTREAAAADSIVLPVEFAPTN